MVAGGGRRGRWRAASLNEADGGGPRVAGRTPVGARRLALRRVSARLPSAVGNVAGVRGTTVDRLRPGGRHVVDLTGGRGLTSERGGGGTVGVMNSDVDAVGWLALKLVGDGPDKSVDALPPCWESDFNHSLGSSPGLAVEVYSNFLS